MALQLKQSLSLNQQLIMTPQLQQAIKLLQLSRLELLENIAQEMETNPVLEEPAFDEVDEAKGFEAKDGAGDKIVSDGPVEKNPRDEMDWEAYVSEYSTGWADSPHEDRDIPTLDHFTSPKTSLYSHLLWQLNMNNLDDTQREIGIHIIGNLDEDGYLKISIEEIVQLTGHSEEKVTETLGIIQNFDPIGVASRNTQECLLIQIRVQNPGNTLVERIILDHMDKLENKRYEQISKIMGVSIQDVLSAVSIITRLEPKPGRAYSDEETIYISPDIYVFKVADNFEILLNEDGLPKLRINSYYRDILSNKAAVADGTRSYIQDKLKSALWLIKSIHQRQRTIYRVTESIVRFQREFLEQGITHLKPLVLRDVADDIQMHESTISRVTSNKYVHTPQGVFALKFFFNSAINSLDGDAVASESVKEQIRNIIRAEDKTRPYSDQEIADMLRKFNINAARRTVAKYREGLKILPSRKRKNPY
ncbi:MAG: RNA polymerase factor sigma-54 [Pseudomonadota bacterium]